VILGWHFRPPTRSVSGLAFGQAVPAVETWSPNKECRRRDLADYRREFDKDSASRSIAGFKVVLEALVFPTCRSITAWISGSRYKWYPRQSRLERVVGRAS
jgi:hypothetical protein